MTHGDYTRVQREIATERAMRRRGAPAESALAAEAAKDSRPGKNGNGAGHGEPPTATSQSGAA